MTRNHTGAPRGAGGKRCARCVCVCACVSSECHTNNATDGGLSIVNRDARNASSSTNSFGIAKVTSRRQYIPRTKALSNFQKHASDRVTRLAKYYG